LLPERPLGIGAVVVCCLVAAAVGLAARPTLERVLFGALALALAAQAALLDAGWVVALDLAAAAVLAALAVSGARLSSLAAPLVRLRDAPGLAPPVPERGTPVLRGSLLGLLVVAPFVALFWQADAAFAQLGRSVPLPSGDPLIGQAAAFVVVLLAALGLALVARRPFHAALPGTERKLTTWEWAVPLALLDVLFLAFVVVQLAVLFGGNDRVLETAGLTYAEYARQGFWQLLAAAALTLAVIGAAAVVAETPRRVHRLLLRGLLGTLCALTVVVLVSAVQRLLLYEDAFGLTRLRLVAVAFALWLGGLFALLLVAGLAPAIRRRLAHVAVAGTALALLGFSLASPDRLIAERNVERWRETGFIDDRYLMGLSADAVPALVGLPAGLHVLDDVEARLAQDEPWSSWNRSRARARALLRDS
jgi:hypothetical protein